MADGRLEAARRELRLALSARQFIESRYAAALNAVRDLEAQLARARAAVDRAQAASDDLLLELEGGPALRSVS